MDLSKVKLVVSDMDGTLLNTNGKVSDDFFELFESLKSHNIHFVAASGRQYDSITNKLARIKDEITIIAENGGVAKQGEKELLFTKLPENYIISIIEQLRKLDHVHTVLCGKDEAYIESTDPDFIKMFSEYYKSFQSVEDLTKVDFSNLLKIAVFHPESSEEFIYPTVKHLESELQVKVSGKNWLDLSHPNANKGYALKLLQEQLGIQREETMVFGDYNNDLEMLDLAYFSYAMENAHPNVVKAAKFQTRSNDNGGVEYILNQLLAAKKV
ncbi:HAD family hydrolase [Robertkochia solimangrovi]|uniref:HAD family hydrolase n=1 Tax=Robertkochia solimangrovi TaxID=2213046 RepID=UPI00117FA56A|nr:HAD family hydrolase [Robertkochia solimangrovi]TRZ41566.1 Cof-type HAD-IIB family hydrolase [Robertkochia solimangrovi]